MPSLMSCPCRKFTSWRKFSTQPGSWGTPKARQKGKKSESNQLRFIFTVIGPHQEMILEYFSLFTAPPREHELPQRVIIRRRLCEASDFGVAPLLVLARVRPVLLALLLCSLDLLGGHHNHASIFLPNHVPEVDNRVRQAALSRDVRFGDKVIVSLYVRQRRHRRHDTKVASNRWKRLRSLMLVVVSTSIHGTCHTHFVQRLTVDALSMVVGKRRVSRVQVLKRCHRRQIRIMITFDRPNVVGVNVLRTGWWTVQIFQYDPGVIDCTLSDGQWEERERNVSKAKQLASCRQTNKELN